MDRRSPRAALVLALLSLPVATWWVVGDVSESGGSDYMFRAPSVLADHGHLIGAPVALLFIACSVAVVSRRSALGSRDLRAALPLAGAGISLGFAYRVMTAAVGGANIGGSLMFMFAVVFVPAMIVVAIVRKRQGPIG